MIYEMGRQMPTPAQRRILREIADDSFTMSLPIDFGNVPCGEKWEPDMSTSTAFRMRNVPPHTDRRSPGDYVGISRPRNYVAVFWLVDMPNGEGLYLQVGGVARSMRQGDFVVFKDSVLHSVISDRVWRGCAYQARPKRT
jgi:hypothetical protein